MGPSSATPARTSPLDSPKLRARALAAMFLFASAVGYFAAAFPAEQARPPVIGGASTLFFIPTATLVTAIVAYLTAERWPGWLWLLVPLVTQLLVGGAMYNTGTIPSGAEIFLLWTLLFATFFLPTGQAIIIGIEAGLVLAAAIIIGPTTVTPVSLWVMLTSSFAGVALVVAVLKTQLEAALARTRADAMTDPLTGLGNRRRLIDDLDTAEHRHGNVCGIALFDLDRFKAFNDTFGHPAGDALLIRLGARLRDTVADAGCAYRLGGDEFCVVVTSCAAPLEDIVASGRAALTEDGPGYSIGASCGHRVIDGALDLDLALRDVDARLYEDKHRRTGAGGAIAVLR